MNVSAASAIPSTSKRLYYGWIVLLVAAAAMVGTLPGRTQGLGLITEPLLVDLKISRVDYAALNFWATIIGTAGAIGIGQLLDRLGSRVTLTLVSVSLGAVVCAMSQATSFWSLAVWITLTRALGQSALSVISLTMVGKWFVRKIDTAMAVYSVVMSVGFMVAFPLAGALIQTWGWRITWLTIGTVILVALAPLSWLFVRRDPEECGLFPDGETGGSFNAARRAAEAGEIGYSWGDALRTPAFWVFAAGAAQYGLVASGIGLFNQSILEERGFGPDVYYMTLVVTAMTALAGNFGGGWLAARIPLGRLMAASLFVLSGDLVFLPYVTTRTGVAIWAAAMGLGGGLVMVLFFSAWPRLYGRKELGRIQGSAQAITVLASALGPILLAWCVEWTGGYAAMFKILAGVIAIMGSSALIVPLPRSLPPSEGLHNG